MSLTLSPVPEKEHKFLIILLHEGHPNLASALDSISLAGKHCHCSYHLAFVNSVTSIEWASILEAKASLLHPNTYSVYDVPFTEEQVEASGGLVGYIVNRAIVDSDADFCLICRDSDDMHPYNLAFLHDFFSTRPHVNIAYTQVIPYHESKILATEKSVEFHDLNLFKRPLTNSGMANIHLTQLVWRLGLNHKGGVWFPYPTTSNIQESFVTQLYAEGGTAYPTGHTSHWLYLPKTGVKIIESAEMDSDCLYQRAECFYNRSDLVSARLVCKDILRANPTHHKALQMMRRIDEML